MGNPVVHFEIAGPDGPALRQFYSDLFGWNIEVQGEEIGNYSLVSANEGGIGGGVYPTTEDMPARSYVTTLMPWPGTSWASPTTVPPKDAAISRKA